MMSKMIIERVRLNLDGIIEVAEIMKPSREHVVHENLLRHLENVRV